EVQRIQAGIHCRIGMVTGGGDAALGTVEESAYDARVAEMEAALVAEETLLEPEHPEVKKLRAQLDHYKQKLPAQQPGWTSSADIDGRKTSNSARWRPNLTSGSRRWRRSPNAMPSTRL
ncbi:MAG: hypothetical protein RDV41_13365, partial [Planctomycetota bacterium]|nr:hypothetical protein [Planctomycetota bacterium]